MVNVSDARNAHNVVPFHVCKWRVTCEKRRVERNQVMERGLRNCGHAITYSHSIVLSNWTASSCVFPARELWILWDYVCDSLYVNKFLPSFPEQQARKQIAAAWCGIKQKGISLDYLVEKEGDHSFAWITTKEREKTLLATVREERKWRDVMNMEEIISIHWC